MRIRTLLTLSILGLLVYIAWNLSLSAVSTTQPERQVRERIVFEKLQRVLSLELAHFQSERIIELKHKEKQLFGLLEAEDAILLVAAGSTSASINLAQLSIDNIVFDELSQTWHLTLPLPHVAQARLDPQRTYVHARTRDWFAQQHIELESQARLQAARLIEQAAHQAGIVEHAKSQAIMMVQELARAYMGIQQAVEIHWESRAQDNAM